MDLFSKEEIHITAIHRVGRYFSQREKELYPPDAQGWRHYATPLYSYEFIFNCSKGSSCVRFGGKELTESPNSVRYLPKGVDGGEYAVKTLEDGYCIDVYFDTPDEMPREMLLYRGHPALQSKMEQLHAIWSEKKSGYYARAMALFYEIISLFVKRQTEYLTPAQRLPLERAQEYLLAHYRTPDFSYAALGEASGVSYSYFKSLFLKQYGISPVRYVTRLRISYAKELLSTGRYTVGQIAAMCGFENTYYFSNVFKKETGCAPTLYVKRG